MATKLKSKKKKEGENVRVNKDLKKQVEAYCEPLGIRLGSFYDIAAKERLERLKQTA